MSLTLKQRARIALSIREHLRKRGLVCQEQVCERTNAPLAALMRIQALRGKMHRCLARGWPASAKQALSAIESALYDLPHQIDGVKHAIQECNVPLPSARDIYRELVQAEEEFGDIECSDQGRSVSVTTEPVELEGFYLGEFQISLILDQLTEIRPDAACRVTALDPHPASSNEGVTHPHVNDERLCPGDAGAAIQAALKAGRICDFFMLVRSVLTHYNPGSPFVSLDEWEGVSCYECGYSMDNEHAHWCEFCEESYCDECYSWCRRCDDSACVRCVDKCPVCEDSMCPSCLTHCPHCGKVQCRNCIDDERCPCHEEEPEDVESEEAAANEAEARTGRREVVTASQAGGPA